MKNDFRTFEKFDNQYNAQQMAGLLTKFNIPFELEDTSSSLDRSFGGGEKLYSIKLKKEDFERAHVIVEEAATAETDLVDPDHYLFSFTDAELRDVVVTRDEWSPFDVILAQKLLKERGHELNNDEIQQMKAQRLRDLSKPDKDQSLYITMGYLFALLGGALGLFIGWHLHSHKKTLPNGERVYGYSRSNRKSGKRIIIISIMSLIGWWAYRYYHFSK